MRWFFSDLHLNHGNIIKFCSRPFSSAKEMDIKLIENCNSVVMPDDTLYCLGDFSFKSQPHFYTRRINCKNLILIQGNHDRINACKGHFKEIHDKLEIEIGGHKILLCHYYYKQMLDSNFDHKFKDRMPQYYPGQVLIHGHCHSSKPHINEEYKAINVSVEQINYTPISEERILEIIKGFK